MDTRSKIVQAESFTPDAFAVFVVAALDPLVNDHAAALEAVAARHGHPLTILLADPPDPLLPAGARAELAAALACVARVVVGGAALADRLPEGATVVREEAADLVRRDRLMRLVASKHAGQA